MGCPFAISPRGRKGKKREQTDQEVKCPHAGGGALTHCQPASGSSVCGSECQRCLQWDPRVGSL